MTDLEIADIPPLTVAQRSLLDMHSVLNLLNVLWTELAVIGLALTRDPRALAASHELVERLKESLADPLKNLGCARDLERHLALIDAEIASALTAHPAAAKNHDVQRGLEAYTQACAVLRVRARELLARAGFPELWTDLSPDELAADLRDVFDAMAATSKGRYRIVYNPAAQGRNDYLVTLRFHSDASPGRLQLPLVFKDVMRDLLANARKYTAPGGVIAATLIGSADSLAFEVTDTGCGIPSEEIRSVVGFGVRGSNVRHIRTLGGGFGLTKAFLVTKQLGGRFWIASELGRGTRVRIRIPRTVATRFAGGLGW